MKTLTDLYANFGEAITGDLKWVLIALIALTLGSMYAASVNVVHADDEEDW